MISEESQDSVYWSIDTENSAFSAISKILLFYCTFVQKKKNAASVSIRLFTSSTLQNSKLCIVCVAVCTYQTSIS